MIRNYNPRAFTLIELLLVVVIIAIMSGIVLSAVNVRGLKQKARDAQRIADLKRVQTALELYFADNRVYPTSGGENFVDGTCDSVCTALEGGYISRLPSDPLETNPPYRYISLDGNSYELITKMEIYTTAEDSPCTGSYSGYSGNTPNLCYGVINPL